MEQGEHGVQAEFLYTVFRNYIPMISFGTDPC